MRQKGFSLIELMVTLVIIGILVSIAIMVYDGIQQRPRETVDEANVRALNSATLQWMMDAEDRDPREHDTESLKSLLKNEYILGWPDSPTGSEYQLSDGRWLVVE